MQAIDPTDTPPLPALTLPRVGTWRILIGLLQGLLLYFLYHAAQERAWPATDPLLFVPLIVAALFVPVLLVSSLGHMNRRQLVLWGGFAALLLAGLGCYDAWRVADLPLAPPVPHDGSPYNPGPGPHRSAFPSPQLLFFTAAGFFIAHSLVMAAVRDRRRIAAYSTHFDIAWKLGVQLAFSGLFTGVTWLVLLLGAQLFELVKLTFLTELMRKAWFGIPVTAFAFSCAMHLTDVRPAIVRGIRGLLLVLMSWLLPVIVLLVGGFLATLPFTGLAPLWATRHAASVLLLAAAAFVVLVNAAWQQGGESPARVVRLAARAATLLLAPIVLIAIYALYLRVRDYGWTGDRVSAAACMLVAACYAAGYFHAGLRRGWLPSLAKVNIAVAFVVIGVLLALFSPLLDPARISVASQVARLESGKVKPDKFDFVYLRFQGERFGRAALERLDRAPPGPDAAEVRRQIAAVRKKEFPWQREQPAPRPLDLAANLRVRTPGARLPEAFLRTDWGMKAQAYQYPECLRLAGKTCDVFLLDVNGDGRDEVMVSEEQRKAQDILAQDVVLGANAQGEWELFATLGYPMVDCMLLQQERNGGKVRAVPSDLSDIVIGNTRVRLIPKSNKPACTTAGSR
jgi:hypothetical protein